MLSRLLEDAPLNRTDVEIQIAAYAVNQTFALNRQTGELTVFDSTDLDFETTPTFMLNVAARSSVTEFLAVTVNLIE